MSPIKVLYPLDHYNSNKNDLPIKFISDNSSPDYLSIKSS